MSHSVIFREMICPGCHQHYAVTGRSGNWALWKANGVTDAPTWLVAALFPICPDPACVGDLISDMKPIVEAENGDWLVLGRESEFPILN